MNALKFTFPSGMGVARDEHDFLSAMARLKGSKLTKAETIAYRALWPRMLGTKIEPIDWPKS
jgi:hypothetical protein